MKTILLTGGRAPATLDLARLFHAAGHTVLVAECLPRHLCQASRAVARCFEVPAPNADPVGFVAGLAAIARDEAVDLLVPTCEEVFHVARAAGRMPCPVFAPAWARLERLHDKVAFIEDVAALGLPTPATWRATSREEVAAALASLAGQKAVLKPVFSRFGTQVHILAPGEPSPGLDIGPARPWVVQAFVAGRALCTYSVANEGRLLAHTAYAPDFTAGTAASVHFRRVDHPALEAWVERLVGAWGLTGQVAFDLIEAPDGTLYPLECNPRATSGVHLFSEADRLDRAFLGTAGAPVHPRHDAHAMIGLAMCVYGLPAAVAAGPERLGEWTRTIASAREAVFRWDDPLPALQQFAVYGELLRRAGLAGTSAIAASTADIEWNGGT